ncbi:hypothetical protein M406DRAFT_321037 [Cryphonectria parasitica EP155]|uniref:Uncharacterized protein n=1 Tax=Cryphonectria parasitica (strain ATCC 38755 / EP155) TaxID=660469 RepID=A0A9P4Y992_CRYP1|nr:uncharacterized protein M406DRAFT_321037 [Cryphonectria parasitica EP155]KAF3768851.1 hypothetical protein M406DRAFT_321037 [Cryphonectria parasitica EP155]
MARKKVRRGEGSSAVDLGNGDVESLRPRVGPLEEEGKEEEEQDQAKPEASSLKKTVKPRRSHVQFIKLRFCHVLIATGLLGLTASLALSLWWSFIHNDVSGGFAIGSYVIAAVSFLVAIPGYRHSMTCTCWTKDDANLDTS